MTITSFFSLPDGYYETQQIKVRVKDAAGNISGIVKNPIALSIDTIAPDYPTVVFPTNPINSVVVVVPSSDTVLWKYSINNLLISSFKSRISDSGKLAF